MIYESAFDLGNSAHGYADYQRYAASDCKVTARIDGDQDFKLTGFKREDWHEGQYGSQGSYTEYGTGPTQGISVTSGQNYTVMVELITKSAVAPGAKSATLIVTEGPVEIRVPLKTNVVKPAYDVKFESLSPTSLKLQPHEDAKINFSVNVKTNTPINLTIKSVSLPNGIKVDPVDIYASKDSTLTGQVRISIPDESMIDHTWTVLLGVYKGDQLLTTMSIPVQIWMKWTKWNYHLETNAQFVDGELLVSGNGLYIWNLSLYNSSKFSSDIFLTAFVFDTPETDGSRLGTFTGGADPMGGVSTFSYHQSGRLNAGNVGKLCQGPLRCFLTVKEGGFFNALGRIFTYGFGPNLTLNLPNGAKEEIHNSIGGRVAKFFIENKLKPITEVSAYFAR